jgi:hypothetical protein
MKFFIAKLFPKIIRRFKAVLFESSDVVISKFPFLNNERFLER